MSATVSDFASGSDQSFVTTHWSVVLAAKQGDATDAAAALEKLCRTYWYPLYAFLRRKGRSPHDAQDLTQAFFAHQDYQPREPGGRSYAHRELLREEIAQTVTRPEEIEEERRHFRALLGRERG